jgi:hypothetical protein
MRRTLALVAAIPLAGSLPACAGGRCCRPCPPAAPPAVAIAPPAPGKAPPPLPAQALPATGAGLVDVKVRFLKVSGAVAGIGNAADLAAGGYRARSVSRRDVEAILAAAEKSETTDMLYGTGITVLEGQRANVQILTQVAYVQRFDVEEKGGTTVADPVVATVVEGLTLELEVERECGGDYALGLHSTAASLQRPIPEEELVIRAGSPPVRVQRPVVAKTGFDARLAVEDGGTVGFSLPGPWHDGAEGTLLALVTVSRSAVVVPPGVAPDAFLAPSNFVAPEEASAPARR